MSDKFSWSQQIVDEVLKTQDGSHAAASTQSYGTMHSPDLDQGNALLIPVEDLSLEKKREWLVNFLVNQFEPVDPEAAETQFKKIKYEGDEKVFDKAALISLTKLLDELIDDEKISIESGSFSFSQLCTDFGASVLENFYANGRVNKEAICYQMLNVPMALGFTSFFQAYFDEFDHENPSLAWTYAIVAPLFLSMSRTIYGFVSKVSHLSEDELLDRIKAKEADYQKVIGELIQILGVETIASNMYSELTQHSGLRRVFAVDVGVLSMIVSAIFTDTALALKLLPGMHLVVRLLIGIVLGLADSFDGMNAVLVSDEHIDLSDHPERLPVLMRDRGFMSRYLNHPVIRMPSQLFVEFFAASALSFTRYLTLKDNLPINGLDVESVTSVSLAYNLVMYLIGLKYGYVFSEFGRKNVLEFFGVDDTQQLSQALVAFSRPLVDAIPLMFVAHHEKLDLKDAICYAVGPIVAAQYIALLGLRVCSPTAYEAVVHRGFVECGWQLLLSANKFLRGTLVAAGGAVTYVGVRYDNRWITAAGLIPGLMGLVSALSPRNLSKSLFIVLGTLYYQVIYLNSVMTLTAPPMDQLRPNTTNTLQTVEMSYDAYWKSGLVIFSTMVAALLVAFCDVNALLNKILNEGGEPVSEPQVAPASLTPSRQASGRRASAYQHDGVMSVNALDGEAQALVGQQARLIGGAGSRRTSQNPEERGVPMQGSQQEAGRRSVSSTPSLPASDASSHPIAFTTESPRQSGSFAGFN